jgi:hypothetical protein
MILWAMIALMTRRLAAAATARPSRRARAVRARLAPPDLRGGRLHQLRPRWQALCY